MTPKKRPARRQAFRRSVRSLNPAATRRRESAIPMGISTSPAKNTIGIAINTRSPMYGFPTWPRIFAGSTNNHDKPARVTSVTPVMVIQWAVSSSRIGGFGLLPTRSFRRIQERDQIRHLRAFEARPGDAFGAHVLEHLRAVVPQSRNHRHPVEGTPGEIGSAIRLVVVAARAMFAGEDAASRSRTARASEELFGPKITQELAHFTRIEFHELRSRSSHTGRVIPHRGRDFGERLSLDQD